MHHDGMKNKFTWVVKDLINCFKLMHSPIYVEKMHYLYLLFKTISQIRVNVDVVFNCLALVNNISKAAFLPHFKTLSC